MNTPAFLLSFSRKHHEIIIPLLAIGALSFITNAFYIDKNVINRVQLLDMAGRSYERFLYEQNLPHSLGAVFIAGTPDNLEKTEKYYLRFETGYIFTNQLRSLLFGTKIHEFSTAAYINFVFGISAALFSILVGYLVFKNGYVSIVVFLLIVIFRNYCQGLIYGLPSRHAYAVFNPLLAFCILVFIILFLKNRSKKYWVIFILSGFAIGYISHCRTSEGYIIGASLVIFTAVMLIESLRIKKEDFKKMLICVSIIFVAMYAGYSGYYKMVTAFENHRDKKFNLPKTEEKVLSKHPAFHSLFVSLFRYPNKFNYSYVDTTGSDAVYKKRPELEKKYSTDYFELFTSEEYNTTIKRLYFDFIFNNPKYCLTYLVRGAYDYFLFLPYCSWTGTKSAHVYLPKINDSAEIEPEDLAPFFKDTPLEFNAILNLRLKYLPEGPLFWVYFVCAYVLLAEAIYTSFIKFRKTNNKIASINEVVENNLPVYLLWGMLIYFFFASIIRILIPVHSKAAVVAFNMVIIYNLARIVASIGTIEIKDIKMPAWLFLLIILSLSSLAVKSFNSSQRPTVPTLNGRFENDISGWTAYKSTLSRVYGGQSGRCLQITAPEDAIGYAYATIPTKIGGTYKFTAYFKRGTAPNGQIKVGTAIDSTDLYYSGVLSDEDWTQYSSGVFMSKTTNIFITLVNLTLKGKTSLFDSVTLTQIRPHRRKITVGKDTR